ncbi:MAG TPA: hypothetical protein VGE40_10625 [Bacilli bacterium]
MVVSVGEFPRLVEGKPSDAEELQELQSRVSSVANDKSELKIGLEKYI